MCSKYVPKQSVAGSDGSLEWNFSLFLDYCNDSRNNEWLLYDSSDAVDRSQNDFSSFIRSQVVIFIRLSVISTSNCFIARSYVSSGYDIALRYITYPSLVSIIHAFPSPPPQEALLPSPSTVQYSATLLHSWHDNKIIAATRFMFTCLWNLTIRSSHSLCFVKHQHTTTKILRQFFHSLP